MPDDKLDNVPDLRAHADSLESDLAKSKAALLKSEVENRMFGAREAFSDAGYEPKFADLYVAAEPEGDLTPEAIKVWTGTFGLEPAEAPVEGEGDGNSKVTETAGAKTKALADLGRGGSSTEGGAGSAAEGDKMITVQEWQRLTKTDPAAAREAASQGRIKLRSDNAWVRGYALSETGSNPYIEANRPAAATKASSTT